MSKSLLSRIKITKRGKIIRRPMGIDHFRTRKTSKSLRNKRRNRGLNYPKKVLLGLRRESAT